MASRRLERTRVSRGLLFSEGVRVTLGNLSARGPAPVRLILVLNVFQVVEQVRVAAFQLARDLLLARSEELDLLQELHEVVVL